MQFWTEIINTALLGTDKRSAASASLPAPLQEAATQIGQRPDTDAEEQFLQLAALSYNFRQSGAKPLHPAALNFPAADAETLPYCTPRAAQVLKDLIAEDNVALLQLWLDRCVAAQQLATADLLPTLLTQATKHKFIRHSVAAVGGRRREWLGRLNPNWDFSATTADEEQLWLTGNLDQRRTALRQMRLTDPAKAREWLAQCWDQENANTRAELLKQLDGTVQAEDEPFLLSPFNEKSQKVKDGAIRLLQQLPDSVLAKKYIETVAPLVTLKKEKALLGLTTKTTLSLGLPAIPEKVMQLPGIDYLSSDKAFKDEEFVLYQLIQYIPPAFWETHLSLPPAGILDFFTGPNEKYISAFAKATAQFKDTIWAQAYLDTREQFYPELIELLSAAQQEAWILKNFHRYPDFIAQQAAGWGHEWSLPMAKLILGYTAKQPYQYGTGYYKAIIHCIPTSILDHWTTVNSIGSVQPKISDSVLEQLRRLLNLKQQTQNAFNA